MTPRLPGRIPGLLRVCSPVVSGVVVSIYEGGCRVAVTDPEPIRDDDTYALIVAQSAVELRLDVATGRAHAAWWLSAYFGLRARPEAGAGIESIGWLAGSYGWVLTGARHTVGWRYREHVGQHAGMVMPWLPELGELDHHDPRLLDDGSRWVDAEALRLVALHVAGGGR